MTAPIRSTIHVLTELPKEANEMTLREAIEWFKRSVRELDGQILSSMEHKELNGQWAFVCFEIAKREGIPTGSLSYFLGELAQAEMRLKESADQEAADNV